MANVKGTNKADKLTGTNAADRIQAQAGNDTIFGLGGNDTIDAGSGDDWIDSGAGSDTIDGGTGFDTLDYSSWSRVSIDPPPPDNSNATAGGSGVASEYDSDGNLIGTDSFSFIERIVGTSGNDLITFPGTIIGGAGDDRLSGWTMSGGEGDDLLESRAIGGISYDGGASIDTAVFGSSFAVIVDLAAGEVRWPSFPEYVDQVVSIENLRGGGGNKQFYGTEGSNIFEGSAGADLLDGRGGDDVIVGDFGRYTNWATNPPPDYYADDIRGGAGNDLLSGDLHSDVLTGGSGADIFVVDTYYGTDRITDFEDGVDMLALYGGLTITGWEARDSDGDGVIDTQAALLSNGEAILFDGAAAPSSLISGRGVVLHSEQFAIPELTDWSAAAGAPWDAGTAAALYAAAATATVGLAISGSIESNELTSLEVAGSAAAAGLDLF